MFKSVTSSHDEVGIKTDSLKYNNDLGMGLDQWIQNYLSNFLMKKTYRKVHQKLVPDLFSKEPKIPFKELFKIF